MWTAPEAFLKTLEKRSRRVFALAAIVAILLVLGSLVATAATAAIAAPAPQSAANPPASAQERTELRRALDSRYEVLPVSGGIVLKPRKARAGIRTIELTGGQVAVNGERVSTRTLRDWLGEDADSILRLQGLSAAEQRQVFGLDGAGASVTPAVPAPPAEPEPTPEPESAVEEAPADVTTSDAGADADVDADVDVAEEPAEPAEPEAETSSGRHSAGSRVNVLGSVHVQSN